jgi:hypothetical protein
MVATQHDWTLWARGPFPLAFGHRDGALYEVSIVPAAQSAIVASGIVSLEQLPDHCVVWEGWRRVAGEPPDLLAVMRWMSQVFPLLQLLSLNNPVAAQVSRRDAEIYQQLLTRRGFGVKFLAGTLAGGTSIIFEDPVTRHVVSDDDQVILILPRSTCGRLTAPSEGSTNGSRG